VPVFAIELLLIHLCAGASADHIEAPMPVRTARVEQVYWVAERSGGPQRD
jgi:hypothetical protein